MKDTCDSEIFAMWEKNKMELSLAYVFSPDVVPAMELADKALQEVLRLKGWFGSNGSNSVDDLEEYIADLEHEKEQLENQIDRLEDDLADMETDASINELVCPSCYALLQGEGIELAYQCSRCGDIYELKEGVWEVAL